MAASVLDVAAYILESQGPMTHMKLQKLCYYSQAWHLAWDGVPLFPERIEAWANGPMIPVLYEALRGEFQVDRGTLAARLADPVVRSRVSARLAEEGSRPSPEVRFNQLKDRLIAATGSPGLTSFHEGKVHMTLSEWESLVELAESARTARRP